MIGTLVSKEPKLTKNEDKYYNVKTDITVEGEEYKVSFNAFNSEYNQFADIVKEIAEGARIEIEVKKDGKFWDLKSIKPAGGPVTITHPQEEETASETAGVDAFADREKSKQLSISTLAMLKSFIEAGLTPDMLQSYAAKCYKVAEQIYTGDIKQYLELKDQEDIPF